MSVMMSTDDRELVHKQIILNLTIRTLERDKKFIQELKMNKVFEMWFEAKIKELHNDLKTTKYELGKRGIKVQSENKVDELITEYVVIARGFDETLRYMNIALRNWTMEETKRLLGLEYNTTKGAN